MGKTAEAESILCLQPFLGAQNQAIASEKGAL